MPDSCCWGNSPSSVSTILQNWSISNIYLDSDTLTISQIQSDFTDCRPFALHYDTHVVLAYGIDDDDIIYIHDPGNGSVMKNYYDLISGTNGARKWEGTTRLTTSASSCPLIHTIPGLLNHTKSLYKATQRIEASCWIADSSEVVFRTPGYVVLNEGFRVSEGCSLTIETGTTIICP